MSVVGRKIRLPTYLATTPAWADYAEQVQNIFVKYVDKPLEQHKSALNINAYHPSHVLAKRGIDFLSMEDFDYEGERWVSKSNRVRAGAMIGYNYVKTSLLGEEAVEVLIESGAQFLPYQGTPQFLSFLNYVLNLQLNVRPLWANEMRPGAMLNTNPELFSHADWTKTNANVSTGDDFGPYDDPQGARTAWRLIEHANNAVHAIDRNYSLLAANTRHTHSWHVRTGSRSWCYFELGNGTTTVRMWVNLNTGVISNNSGVLFPRVYKPGDGTLRISGCLATSGTGTLNTRLGMATGDGVLSYTGNGASYLIIWGAMLEKGISASAYYNDNNGEKPLAELGYGPMEVEGSDNVGVPVYEQGSWFPTAHIDVDISGNTSINFVTLFDFLKFVSPINLVLRHVVFNQGFEFSPLGYSAALQMHIGSGKQNLNPMEGTSVFAAAFSMTIYQL